MSYFPLFFDIKPDDKILLVGGGLVATAKLEALSDFKENLYVVAQDISDNMRVHLTQNKIQYRETAFIDTDLENTKIVIAATNDDILNEHIATLCRQKNILVNVVDNTPLCDFIFPALVKRGDVQIAISSSGVSPVMARLIKHKIEQILPYNLNLLVSFIREKTKLVREKLKNLQARRLFWEKILKSSITNDVLECNFERAEYHFQNLLSDTNDKSQAALYLIGAGAGHPDLMTFKAAELLSQADVVLYDRLVAIEVLDRFARKDALKISVGKKRGCHSFKQEEIDALIGKYLKENKIVARLKGGDVGIFAHVSEELKIAKNLNVPYQIIPGITAASACAAYAGIPLTERDGARSLRILTLYERDLFDETYWKNIISSRDETLVFYMSLKYRKVLCDKLIEYGFDKNTPILAIEQGTTPFQYDYIATVGTFAEKFAEVEFMSPTLLIIGDVVKLHKNFKWKENNLPRQEFFDGARVFDIQALE